MYKKLAGMTGLHRKNSLFYKTLNGAEVGDLYMSLIHTCELNDVNPSSTLPNCSGMPESLLPILRTGRHEIIVWPWGRASQRPLKLWQPRGFAEGTLVCLRVSLRELH